MAEFISELEALDQTVANLLVSRLALVTSEALAEAPYGIAERGCIELHPTTSGTVAFPKHLGSCNSHSTDAFPPQLEEFVREGRSLSG
jgi:hypothetical protein